MSRPGGDRPGLRTVLDRPAALDVGLPQAPAALLTVLTVGVGVLVANLYYAQPLIASIGAELHISPDVAGSVVSVAQIGYGTGLFLLVPAADFVENKRLVLTLMGLTVAGLVGLATSSSTLTFFVTSFLVGLCATGGQAPLPFAAHLLPEERRSRLVGNIMAGVLTGIMLARPAALFTAGTFGWRAVFWILACLVSVLGPLLARMMPTYRPAGGMRYGRIIVSMVALLPRMPVLCWRSTYAALIFGAFNMFWTAAPLMLADRFGLGHHVVGLFALAGAGGALAVSLAGRLAGVTSRFAQSRTLSGKGQNVRGLHKRGYTNRFSLLRQIWRFPLRNPLSELGQKVSCSCMGLAVQF